MRPTAWACLGAWCGRLQRRLALVSHRNGKGLIVSGLDARSPLVVDIGELGRRPGSMLQRSRGVAAPAELGTEVIAVATGSPIALSLRFEAVMEGVLASGAATGSATGECVRCLDPVTYPVKVTFSELYVYPDKASAHAENSDEQLFLDGDLLDVEPVLRDAIVTALPFQPVCREDCPGLCAECGQRLAEHPDHRHEIVDPRWSALSQLLGSEDSAPSAP